MSDNFKWVDDDIDNTLVLKIVSKGNNESYGAYCVYDILETDGDEIDVKTANIDDLTSLLMLGMIRFINISDNNDILDIPLRNIGLLYENARVLGEDVEGRLMCLEELDAFSVIDGELRDDVLLFSGVIGEASDDLKKLMNIASNFGKLGMQEKLDALNDITMINHRRIINDKKERELK